MFESDSKTPCVLMCKAIGCSLLSSPLLASPLLPFSLLLLPRNLTVNGERAAPKGRALNCGEHVEFVTDVEVGKDCMIHLRCDAEGGDKPKKKAVKICAVKVRKRRRVGDDIGSTTEK